MRAGHANVRRVGGLTLIASGALLLGSLGAARAAEQNVDWMNAQNVTVHGTWLEKTGGCQGCDDAGAVSRQMLRSDGYVEFSPGETNTIFFAGLSRDNNSTRYQDIDYAWRFNGAGTADVMENGVYKGGDSHYTTGDAFRVAVVRGKVQYLKNGQVMYESARLPNSPLVFDTTLNTVGATVRNTRIEPNLGFTTFRNQGEGNVPGLTVYVDARDRWTDTSLYVQAGDRITFDADGVIQLSDRANDTATPMGSRINRRADSAPLRSRLAGSLIARIGDSGAILVGDSGQVLRAPVSGRLYLGVNDDYLEDNSGQFRVTMTVNQR